MGLVLVKEYRLNLDLLSIKEYVYSLKNSTSIQANKSNKGGWQSIIQNHWPPILNELKVFIQKQIPDMTFTTLWFNVNGYQHYNELHRHNNTSEGYSGVFYIDVPDQNMGNLYFEDGTEYEPIPNKLILFPTNLIHGVHPNMSHKNRVSMSFNYLHRNYNDGLQSGICVESWERMG